MPVNDIRGTVLLIINYGVSILLFSSLALLIYNIIQLVPVLKQRKSLIGWLLLFGLFPALFVTVILFWIGAFDLFDAIESNGLMLVLYGAIIIGSIVVWLVLARKIKKILNNVQPKKSASLFMISSVVIYILLVLWAIGSYIFSVN